MKNRYLTVSMLAVVGVVALTIWSFNSRSGSRSGTLAPAPTVNKTPLTVAPSPKPVKDMTSIQDAISYLESCTGGVFDAAEVRHACKILVADHNPQAIVALVRYIDLHISVTSGVSTRPEVLTHHGIDLQKIIIEQYPVFMALLSVGKPAAGTAVDGLIRMDQAAASMRSYLLEQFLLNVNGRDDAVALLIGEKSSGRYSDLPDARYNQTLNELMHIAIDRYQVD